MGVPTVYAKLIETAKERKNDEIVEKVKTKNAISRFHFKISDLFYQELKWNFLSAIFSPHTHLNCVWGLKMALKKIPFLF